MSASETKIEFYIPHFVHLVLFQFEHVPYLRTRAIYSPSLHTVLNIQSRQQNENSPFTSSSYFIPMLRRMYIFRGCNVSAAGRQYCGL